MIRENPKLLSEYDGLEVSLLEIKPEKKIRGIVQLVHGMSEHKERYIPLMEYLAQKGFACVIHDHRGHGKSVKSDNDLGYMYGGGATAIVQDIAQVNGYIKAAYGNLPLILLGHSMGSMAVRVFLKKHDAKVDAVILCGSPSKNPALPLGKAVCKVQQLVLGKERKDKLMEALAFGAYAARFPGEKSKFAWTCSDPEVVKEYDESKFCGFTFTVDGYQGLLRLMEETYSEKGWECKNPSLPILFMSGQEDPCMGSIRKFKKTIDFIRGQGYSDVRGKIYPGMRHEVLNEIGKEQVYHDIYCFIYQKI